MTRDGTLADDLTTDKLSTHYAVVVNKPGVFGYAVQKMYGGKDTARFIINENKQS